MEKGGNIEEKNCREDVATNPCRYVAGKKLENVDGVRAKCIAIKHWLSSANYY